MNKKPGLKEANFQVGMVVMVISGDGVAGGGGGEGRASWKSLLNW